LEFRGGGRDEGAGDEEAPALLFLFLRFYFAAIDRTRATMGSTCVVLQGADGLTPRKEFPV
jgi:hypothetical protein